MTDIVLTIGQDTGNDGKSSRLRIAAARVGEHETPLGSLEGPKELIEPIFKMLTYAATHAARARGEDPGFTTADFSDLHEGLRRDLGLAS